ncbi:MAG: S-layer homology domain-containing protein [Bacillota bacterium]
MGRRLFSVFLVFILAASLLSPMGSSAVQANGENFADIKGHWAEKEIRELIEKGIVNGQLKNGKLVINPNIEITRAEFFTIVIRSLKADIEGSSPGKSLFKDVDNHWAKPYIEAARRKGITTGYKDGTFKPNQNISRAEVVAALIRAYEIKGSAAHKVPFKDITPQHWAYTNIQIAVEQKIINGYPDNTFKPENKIKRAESFVIIHRIINRDPEEDNEEKDEENEPPTNPAEPVDNGGSGGSGGSGDSGGSSKPLTVSGQWDVDSETETLRWKLTWQKDGNSKSYNIYRSFSNEKDSFEKIADEVADNFYEDEDFSLIGPTYYKIAETHNGAEIRESSPVMTDVTADADEDGLPDAFEMSNGTDRMKPDTDDDGLPDGYEVNILNTDPTSLYTNSSKTEDGKEDFDQDGLNNLQEFSLETDPYSSDTDEDSLSDGDEVNQYGTDPLKRDTDNDLLEDDSELKFGTDPKNPDTDKNGIMDGNEKRDQTVQSGSSNITIAFNAAGDASKTTTFHQDDFALKLIGQDGIVGKPVDIKTTSAFDNATVNFSYDANSLGSIEEDNLRVFYFNPDTWKLELVETQTIDKETKTVSADLKHFSTYVLADWKKWLSTFIEDPEPIPYTCDKPEEENKDFPLDLVFVIDSSGSMGPGPDDRYNKDLNNDRIKGTKLVIDSLNEDDRAAIVDFDDYSTLLKGLTHATEEGKEELKTVADKIDSNGGTSLSSGLSRGVSVLEKDGRNEAIQFIIFLTDGQNNYSYQDAATVDQAIKAAGLGIKVFTIGLGESLNADLLQEIADKTDGDFYQTLNAEELTSIFAKAKDVAQDLDTDGDCIMDWAEKLSEAHGGYIVEGTLGNTDYTSDFEKAHSDNDGLTDLEELAPQSDPDSIEAAKANIIVNAGKSKIRLKEWPRSNPEQTDTDGDNYDDKEDLKPRREFLTPVILIHGRTDNSHKIFGLTTAISYSYAYDSEDFKNSHYLVDNVLSYGKIDREKSVALNDINYYDAASHEIIGNVPDSGSQKTPGYLGNRLIEEGYDENENLFVINYPNVDFNWKNADILKWFIEENLKEKKDSYPTKSSYTNKELKVDLIGHSNGGLVSRYYIENLNGSSYVNKLITLNTPHWGSGLATASTSTPVSSDPMDVDLEPNGLQYGGKEKTMIYINNTKQKYINAYQTKALNYSDHGSTDYYFLGGYDDSNPKGLPEELEDKTFLFDVNPKSNSFKDFRNSIAEGFFTAHPNWESSIKFNFTKNGGDNVVNNQSQLGITYKDFGDGKQIFADGYSMLIDTFAWHHAKNHFHGEMPHRQETADQVLRYLYQ